MDHSQAISLKATEKYLLGELKEPSRGEFEEHFMSCGECARDVRVSAMFVENAREVLRTPASEFAPGYVPESAGARLTTGWFTGLFRPVIAAPAFAILLGIIAYQAAVVLPHARSAQVALSAPQTLASFSLIDANSRGGSPATFAVQPGQPFSIDIDVPPQPSFSMYNLEVDNENGTPQFSVPISAEEARKTVQLLVPSYRLAAGQYILVIRGTAGPGGASGTEVLRSRFALEYGSPRPSAPAQ
jgi:hypothetical protein